MNILDGYNGGVAHITADMVRDHNISFYGEKDVVLDVGNKFDYEIVDNNTITIKDGMAVIGGARVNLGYGKTETAVIENGTSGYYRNDIICIEFARDNATLIETATLKVVKGEITADAGVDPERVKGDIRAGATVHQMPLYRVKVNGLSIEAVEQMWIGTGLPYGATTPEEALAILGGTGWELIWENASISSDFTATTLEGLDLNDASMVAIEHYGQYNQPYSGNGTNGFKIDFIGVGRNGALQSATLISNSLVAFIQSRAAMVQTDRIVFNKAACVYGTNTSQDVVASLKPTRIYKLKNISTTIKE